MTLASTDWLNENLTKVKIIDASWHLDKNRNAIEEYNRTDADLVLPPDHNLGGCMIVKVSSLEKVCKVKKETNTECWVKFFEYQKQFKIHILSNKKVKTNKFIKTSLDYFEDYVFINRIFNELDKPNQVFTTEDIINLVKAKPDLGNENIVIYF